MAEDGNETALRQELALAGLSGWQRRKEWILSQFTEWAAKVSLGLIPAGEQREQAIGRCQAYKEILDRDDQVLDAWREIQREDEAKAEEKEEGGNLGVHYEAAQ